MISRLILFVLLLTPVMGAEPVLEVYDLAPPTSREELRLVLKLSNPTSEDVYVFAEGLSWAPLFVKFVLNGKEVDWPTIDCGTGARSCRLKSKTYALIDFRVMQDILISRPVKIRALLFSDPACTHEIWTNELKITPDDFTDTPKPNSERSATP